jgi:uncharacterized protein YgfB (UPF0149 family)
MNNAELALQEWIKTQTFTVSGAEQHGFINGYNLATEKTLTDNEIDNLIADVAEKPTNEDLYDFAKAILKKVQE